MEGAVVGHRTARRRVAAKHPFSADSPFNISMGDGAFFETTLDAQTAAVIAHTPGVNHLNWTVAIAYAASSDPVCSINHPVSGALLGTCLIPPATTPPGGTDRHTAVIQPDGITCYGCYQMSKVDDTHWTSTFVAINDLTGTGITAGARASGTSVLGGLIRSEEVTNLFIPHTIYVSLPNSLLKTGFVWPARAEDGDSATAYAGIVPMGSMFAIPPSTDISALSLSPEGRALAVCLQDYGAHVLIRGDNFAVYVEPPADLAAVQRMRDDWEDTLHSLVRRVTNNTANQVAGGGTRRQPEAIRVEAGPSADRVYSVGGLASPAVSRNVAGLVR